MNSRIALFLVALAVCASYTAQAQSIVGKWQLVKQTSCLDENLDTNEETGIEELVDDMKSMSGATPQVIQFKDKNVAEESTRIISKSKSYNSKSLLYKFSGDALHFLDKKSRTILESFTVEKFEADHLQCIARMRNQNFCQDKMISL